MASIPCVKLNSGYDCPVLGLGTWQSKGSPGDAGAAVEHAINAGYRHIDCAMAYENEKEIGAALRAKIEDGSVTREQLFITSKLWNTDHEPEDVEVACKKTLSDLGLKYLDLYLIHFPVAYDKKGSDGIKDEMDPHNKIILSDRDYLDTWRAMEKLVHQGLVRSIGVSNFSLKMVNRIIEEATIAPVTNQVECHPYLNNKELSDALKQLGVVITAYSPFYSPARPWAAANEPKLMDEPKITAVANKYGKTPAQVLLKYQIDRGHITIPKSSSFARMKENANIFDFKLTKVDMDSIYSLECNRRCCDLEFVKNHKYYPF